MMFSLEVMQGNAEPVRIVAPCFKPPVVGNRLEGNPWAAVSLCLFKAQRRNRWTNNM
jgi:hypothetical protein